LFSFCSLILLDLLITKDGVIKLADFGIATTAKGGGGDSKVQSFSVAEGSPFWMAPEVIQMEDTITSAADIWSLGCTLVELLTGFPPYFDTTAMNAMWKMVHDETPPLPDDISDELADFFKCCFAREPADRPSASELLDHPWVLRFSRRDAAAEANRPRRTGAIANASDGGGGGGAKPDLATVLGSVRLYTEARENPHANKRTLAAIDWTNPSAVALATSPRRDQQQQQAADSLNQQHTSSSAVPDTDSASITDGESNSSPRRNSSSLAGGASGAAQASSSSAADVSTDSERDTDTDSEKRDSSGSTGRRSSSRSNKRSASSSSSGSSSPSSSSKKLKKFTFKDLQDRFEALSSNIDYVVYIVGFENKRNLMFAYTVFRVKVCLDQKRWLIARTFSDFKELHSKLEKALPTIRLPTLPPSKFFGAMSTDFIKQRKNELQVYTESLLKIPSVCKSDIFQFFLNEGSCPA
jgi:serine/threonine protein kinase